MDRIRLRGVAGFGHHGVLPEERRDGQHFSVDADLWLPLRPAGTSDDLADTVSYAAVAQRIVAEIEGEPVALIEALAERIAAACWEFPSLARVRITVHKPAAPIPVAFGDVAVTIERSRPRIAVIALGANVGDPVAQLRQGACALDAAPGCRVVAASHIYATAPVGVTDQPDFRNGVVLARTDLAAGELLAVAQDIEDDAGRTRERRWGPRTLDVDLIAVGGERHADGLLTLPHPRAAERAFVLRPWLDVDPDAILPGVGPVARLAERLADQHVQRTDDELLVAQ